MDVHEVHVQSFLQYLSNSLGPYRVDVSLIFDELDCNLDVESVHMNYGT